MRHKINRKAQKGYVLAIVLILTLVMSISILSTFSVVYRYMKLTERGIEDLHNEVYLPAVTSEVTSNA